MKTDNAPVSVTIQGNPHTRLSRRAALQWVMGAVAASALPTDSYAQAAGSAPSPTLVPPLRPATHPATSPATQPFNGYGTDPNLVRLHTPGDLWPLTFNEAQRATATALADVILPKDELGPAASELGVPAWVDEWISAPYPQQQADRKAVLEGLMWIEAESGKRFGKSFSKLSADQHKLLCDDVCYAPTAMPDLKRAASFFGKFRSLCAGAYYATPAGWKAIGYVGNVALGSFDGPPAEVLEKLGVAQTVL